MDISKFHTLLLGTDPTPDQRRLYEAFPTSRGFSGESQDAERFVATFIVALSDTWDPEAKAAVNTVPLAIPRAIEPWCMDQINLFLESVKARRKLLPKVAIKQFVAAVKLIETGTRVFSLTSAPKRWVAFGFARESVAPEWLKDELL